MHNKKKVILSSCFTPASKKAAFARNPEPDPEEPSQKSAAKAPPRSSHVRSKVLPKTAAAVNCTAVFCNPSNKNPFQSTDKTTLSSFTIITTPFSFRGMKSVYG